MRPFVIILALLTATVFLSPALARIPRTPRVEPARRVLELPHPVEPQIKVQQVRYYAKTSDYLLFLTRKDPVLVLGSGVLRIRLLGGSPEPAITAEASCNEDIVRFIGIEPSSTTAEPAGHSAVRYRDVYPGVDLVFRSGGDYVEHDFIVAPGGDPSAIRLRFDGAKEIHVDDDGALVMRIGDIEFTLSLPVVYQESTTGTDSVDARYTLAENGVVRFDLGPYDTSRTLFID